MNAGEIKVGTIATVKVGRNEIQAEVITITENGWRVKSQSSGKEFEVKKLERIINEPKAPEPGQSVKAKKLSLIDAAYQILREAQVPLNAKEMVAMAIEKGLWIPTACATPEQTLYGSIFREIATREYPRFSKSTMRKGAFVAIGE